MSEKKIRLDILMQILTNCQALFFSENNNNNDNNNDDKWNVICYNFAWHFKG